MASTTKDKLTAAAAGAAIALVVSRYLKKQAPYDATHDEVRAIVRPNIRKLEPYRCARDDYEEGVLLDANENAYGACVKSDEALVKAALKFDLHRYPCPHQRTVKDEWQVPRREARQRVCGSRFRRGHRFIVSRVLRAADRECRRDAGDLWHVQGVCGDAGCRSKRSANLLPESFDVDVDAVEQAVDTNTRLVFLCSPGNPTARQVPRQTVERLLASPKLQRTIVVVDEAYVDFAPEPSTAPLVKTYPRLVVLHTLSKAFGLAGVRCGTAIGSPATIHYMNAVKAPYSINKMTSCLAAEALSSPSLAALQSSCTRYIKGARATRGAARFLILRVHGLSFRRELFLGAPEAARQGEAALHEAGRERGGGPLSRRPGQFIRVHPRDRGDALRFGFWARLLEAAGRGRAGVWVGLRYHEST